MSSRASSGSPSAALVELLIAEAPQLVRRRSLLPSFDWTGASPGQVGRLLQGLAEAGVAAPAWLTKALVLAGHKVPPSALRALSPQLRGLCALRALPDGATVPAELRADLAAADINADSVVVCAIAADLAARGEAAVARRIALADWRHWPQVTRKLRAMLDNDIAGLEPLPLRLAGFSLTQELADALKLACAAVDRQAVVSQAHYGEVMPALMQPTAAVEPLLVMLDAESLHAADWRQDGEAHSSLLTAKLDGFAAAVRTFCGGSSAPLLINSLPAAIAPAVGHIDRQHPAGAAVLVDTVNRRLADLARELPTLHLVDADAAMALIAPDERCDDKLWYYGRVAYSDAATRALAQAFAHALDARLRGPAKVLALDFDNTLWGGVYGDDGIDKLACGDDFPGNAYRALQREALRLKAQGMILVGVSKNNADAIDVFARHPGMLLKADDFAATAIDWNPKPDNIKRLAAELNLGLDSFVFIDDSAHEREAMRLMCPAVTVPEMPADPAQRPTWLRRLERTWPLRLTREDAQRSAMYAADRKARSLRESAASFDDYLAGLEQKLVVELVSPSTLARAGQLHQRTNQFNLTTRRLGEAELAAYMNAPERGIVLLGQVTDRFGDHGIVAAAVASLTGNQACIESLVMSCRVMGRQVEAAFLRALIGRLLEAGAERIDGRYLPTAKNAMVREFFAAHGFTAAGVEGEGTAWTWVKNVNEMPQSPHVAVEWRVQ